MPLLSTHRTPRPEAQAPSSRRLSQAGAAVLLSAVLSACGGGSDTPDVGAAASAGGTAVRVSSCGNEGGTLRVMPLGDSITEGEANHNSYRSTLWQRLQGAGCQVDLVGSKTGVSSGYRNSPWVSPPNTDFDQDHEGYWDYRVNELLPFIGGKVSSAQPDVVLIHMGTNDVLGGQSAAGVAGELSALIDVVRAGKADTYIVLAKVIPAASNPSATAALNRQIDGIVASKNSAASPVVAVDQAAGYSTADNYDGVHPNPDGEAKLGNKWADAVLAWRTR
jgi:acyl-CoA thioesterase-1